MESLLYYTLFIFPSSYHNKIAMGTGLKHRDTFCLFLKSELALQAMIWLSAVQTAYIFCFQNVSEIKIFPD